MPSTKLEPLAQFLSYIDDNKKNSSNKINIKGLQEDLNRTISTRVVDKAFNLIQLNTALLLKFEKDNPKAASGLKELCNSLDLSNPTKNTIGKIGEQKILKTESYKHTIATRVNEVKTLMGKSDQGKIDHLEELKTEDQTKKTGQYAKATYFGVSAAAALTLALVLGASGAALGLSIAFTSLSGATSIYAASKSGSKNDEIQLCDDVISQIKNSRSSKSAQTEMSSLLAASPREQQTESNTLPPINDRHANKVENIRTPNTDITL